jgi:hypothetical protein
VSEPAFYFWRRELKLRQRPPVPVVPFVELQGPAPAAPPALELLLPRERQLRIRSGCDLQLLVQVLQALEEAC